MMSVLVLALSCNCISESENCLRSIMKSNNIIEAENVFVFSNRGCHSCIITMLNKFQESGVPENCPILVPDTEFFQEKFKELDKPIKVYFFPKSQLFEKMAIWEKGGLIELNSQSLIYTPFTSNNLQEIIEYMYE